MLLGLEPPPMRYLRTVELPTTPPLPTAALGTDIDAGERLVEEGPSGPNSGPLQGSTAGWGGSDVDVVEDLNEESPREESAGDRHPSTSRIGAEERIVCTLESSMAVTRTNSIGGNQGVERNGEPTTQQS